MARIRSLKPSFWEDPSVCRLSRDARLTAIAIISYADDRGRLDFSPAAIRGYAFRHDNVSDKRVQGWMLDVVDSGIASDYEVGGFRYLWLPKFWCHQVINRPTESQLPPHPEDPYGHLPIKEAHAQFREDSENDSVSHSRSPHGGLTPSRAGARSFPIPSSPEVDVQKKTTEVSEAESEQSLFDYWRERCGHPDAKFTADRRSKLRARRREGYTDEQIRSAIDGAARAPFINDAGKRFDDLELICRSGSKLESFIDRRNGPAPGSRVVQMSEREAVNQRRLAALQRVANRGDAA